MTTVVPGGTLRKLTALGYPYKVSLEGAGFKTLLLFLEEAKIRFWSKAERGPLRNLSKEADTDWWDVAQKYLQELGLVFAEPRESLVFIVDRLASFALQDEYLDTVQAGEIVSKETPQCAGAAAVLDAGERTRLRTALCPLLEHLNLPTLPADAGDSQLLSATKCIKTRLEPPSEATDDPTQAEALEAMLQKQLGFDLTDSARPGVIVLRALHIKRLRDIQCEVNKVHTALQQITADPKTNSTLGRVGR